MEALLTTLCLFTALPTDEKPPSKDTDSGVVTSILADIPISDPKILQHDGKPPVIFYPPSRRSKKWITVGNIQHAVDGGVEWKGKIAYYSLHTRLIVTDVKSGKTLWHASDSAFWNTLTFENLAKDREPEQWVVVLKSSGHPEFSQSYDLNTGKRHALRGVAPPPPGTKLTPRKHWSGTNGVAHSGKRTLVGSAEEWTNLRKELFGEKPIGFPEASEIDFTTEMLLVLYDGETGNPSAPTLALVVENDKSLVVRVKVPGFQVLIVNGSLPNLRTTHPYVLAVLPRRVNKPVVLEYDRRVYIGGPDFWKEHERLILKAEAKAPDRKDK